MFNGFRIIFSIYFDNIMKAFNLNIKRVEVGRVRAIDPFYATKILERMGHEVIINKQ